MKKDGANGAGIKSKKRGRSEREEEKCEPPLKAVCGEAESTIDPPDHHSASQDPVGYGYCSTTGELLVRYPIAVLSHREGIHKCDLIGKQSLSGFKSVSLIFFL